MKRFAIIFAFISFGLHRNDAIAQDLQPFAFKIKTLIETLDYLGSPVAKDDKINIESAVSKNDNENRHKNKLNLSYSPSRDEMVRTRLYALLLLFNLNSFLYDI